MDANGEVYDVEIQGKRTKEGINFKAKDVAVMFKSDRFVEIVQREGSTFKGGTKFVVCFGYLHRERE